VLVVVGGVADVAMRPVDEVDVIVVGHRRVPAIVGMHVHMPAVGHVLVCNAVVDVVHVIVMRVVDMAIVQEVEMIVVLHGGVAAEAIVLVLVVVVGLVGGGLHGHILRPPGSGPLAARPASVTRPSACRDAVLAGMVTETFRVWAASRG